MTGSDEAATELDQGQPIVAKAEQVHAAANSLLADEQRRAESERVLKRVSELQQALDHLETVVAAARRLASVTGAAFDLTAAGRGRARFADAANNLPPDAVFVRARRDVAGATERIGQATSVEWTRWTGERLADLPLQRVVVLPEDERAATRRRESQLRTLTGRPTPSVSDITEFLTTYELLAETLEAEADPPDGVLDVLQRLTEGASIRLGELSDDQVALLRVSGLADQIELRRSRT